MRSCNSKPNQVQAPTKRHWQSEAALVGKCATLLGFAGILKTHPPAWMWMILTKANALCIV